MFIAQLLKLLFFAAFIYALISLFRFIMKAGRVADERRKQENIRKDGPGPRKRDGVIEIDKDHYKVE